MSEVPSVFACAQLGGGGSPSLLRQLILPRTPMALPGRFVQSSLMIVGTVAIERPGSAASCQWAGVIVCSSGAPSEVR